MFKEKESVIRKAMMVVDELVISFSFFLSYFLRQHFHQLYKFDLMPFSQVAADATASISDYLVLLFFVAPLWCGMLYLNGMYYSMRTRKFLEIVRIIIRSSFFTFLAFGTVVFLFKLKFVSRMFFAIFVVTSLFFILSEKAALFSIMRYARKKGYNYREILIVGTGRRAAKFINKIQNHPEWGFKILGAIDDEPGRGIEKVSNVKVIGTLEDILSILHREAIDEIIFVVPRSRLSHIENTIYDCEIEGVKTTIAVDLFDLKIARSHPTELDGIPLLRFETTVAKEWQLFVKRIMDVVISGLGIVLLSPLFLIVVVSIKLTSSGPLLFKQERLGLNGRKFILYKFRTMYKGAQEALSKVEDLNMMHGGDFKKKKIKWITLVGRLLRKFSVDELPQLFNVFIGHMSIIGPRPTVPDEVEKYKSWQRRRFSMKPGITCLWQIKGRNKIGYDEWMKLDLEYLDNWSLWLDLKILFKTIPVVLFGIGAY
jgi:exopolysaccharide biosynthesis polyprenyl glycosylphosphotransferase